MKINRNYLDQKLSFGLKNKIQIFLMSQDQPFSSQNVVNLK